MSDSAEIEGAKIEGRLQGLEEAHSLLAGEINILTGLQRLREQLKLASDDRRAWMRANGLEPQRGVDYDVIRGAKNRW